MAGALLAMACVPQLCNASDSSRRAVVDSVPQRIRVSSDQNAGSDRVNLFSCESEFTENLTQGLSQAPGVQLSLAMADFTGDRNPDTATVNVGRLDAHRAQYFIEVALTEGGRQLFSLSAPPGGLFISPQDVTGDGTLDLVVRAAESRAVVAVFLNDGCGRFSQPATDTQASVPRDEGPTVQASPAPMMAAVSAVTQWPSGAETSYATRRQPRHHGTQAALPDSFHINLLALSYGSNRAPPQIA
jgi:hypothetical protein